MEVLNDSGRVLLNENRYNPSLVASGSATTADASGFIQFASSYISIYHTPTGPRPPILAIRPTEYTWLHLMSYDAGTNQWRWTYVSEHAVGASIPYWIFDRPTGTAENYGLQVWDASGTLTYSTQRKPLRVYPSLITGDMPETATSLVNPSAESFTFASGRSYAFATGKPASYRKYYSTGGGNQALFGFNNACRGETNGLGTRNFRHSQGANTTSPVLANEKNWRSRLYIPIDVTNY